jgi:hypothetical protein
MFPAGAIVGFRDARRTGPVHSGVTAGMSVAVATFSIYSLLVLVPSYFSMN